MIAEYHANRSFLTKKIVYFLTYMFEVKMTRSKSFTPRTPAKIINNHKYPLIIWNMFVISFKVVLVPENPAKKWTPFGHLDGIPFNQKSELKSFDLKSIRLPTIFQIMRSNDLSLRQKYQTRIISTIRTTTYQLLGSVSHTCSRRKLSCKRNWKISTFFDFS